MPRCGAYVIVHITGFDDECRDVPVGWSPDSANAEQMAARLERAWVPVTVERKAVVRKRSSRKLPKLDESLIQEVLAEIQATGGIQQSLDSNRSMTCLLSMP
jgi:hypothetical protein